MVDVYGISDDYDIAGWLAWLTGSSGQKSWEGSEGKHWSWDGMAGSGGSLPLLCQPSTSYTGTCIK